MNPHKALENYMQAVKETRDALDKLLLVDAGYNSKELVKAAIEVRKKFALVDESWHNLPGDLKNNPQIQSEHQFLENAYRRLALKVLNAVTLGIDVYTSAAEKKEGRLYAG